MTMLRNAERAFFDSVLAYEALDADIFAHLLAAAKKRSEDIEEDVKDETKNGGAAAVRKHSREGMDSLSDAITQAILRKRRLKMLHGVRSELLEAVKYCEEEERKEAAIAARHGVDDVRAKGKLLLKSHLRMKTGELEDSLRKIDTATTETVEIICWEYITAYDEKESVRSTIGEFLQSIAGEFEKIWNGVSHRVIEEICQRDVRFFDAYLTALLKAAEGNAVGNSEGEEENVEDNSGTQDIKRRRIETVSKVQEEAKRRVLSLGDRCGYVFTNIDLDLEVSALEF